MAKRKMKSRSKKKNKSFTIFFVVVIILALVSFAISYFVLKTDSDIVNINTNIEVQKKPAIIKEIVQVISIIDGTWASYNDGAMLTITGHKFSIELPSVESTILASGTLEVVNNTVIFVYTNNSNCGTTPGVYRFIIVNEEVTFVKDSDNCGSRVGLLVATWFKV